MNVCRVCADDYHERCQDRTEPIVMPSSTMMGAGTTASYCCCEKKRAVVKTADALFTEIEELYLSGILDAPDEDDADDPRRPLYDAVNAYRAARGGKVS